MTRHLISDAAESAQVRQRKIDADPTRSDFESEFGKDKVKTEKDGSWSLKLHKDEDIKRAYEMQNGSRRIEVERGAEMQARMKREKIVRKDGRVVDFPEELVDTVKNKAGIRPAGRGGRSVAIRSHLSSSYGKYEQGPDGLWFVWNDGWEPTRLFVKGELPGEQRDPDGNLWTRQQDGEWVVETPEAS